MVSNQGETTGLLETPQSKADHLAFTESEVDFLLDRLEVLKGSDSIDETEEELADFLIKQLNKLTSTDREESKGEELESVSTQKETDRIEGLKSVLANRLGEFIVLSLRVGGECCQVEGVLAGIGVDFVSLIDQDLLIEVKINQIAAVSKTTDLGIEAGTDCNQGGCEVNNTVTDLEDSKDGPPEEFKGAGETEVDNKDKTGVEVNKRQRSYTELEDE